MPSNKTKNQYIRVVLYLDTLLLPARVNVTRYKGIVGKRLARELHNPVKPALVNETLRPGNNLVLEVQGLHGSSHNLHAPSGRIKVVRDAALACQGLHLTGSFLVQEGSAVSADALHRPGSTKDCGKTYDWSYNKIGLQIGQDWLQQGV